MTYSVFGGTLNLALPVYLVVAAILHDTVWAVSLLPCVADCCCMLYTVCL